MLTSFAKDLLDDIGNSSVGYGTVLAGWRGTQVIFHANRPTVPAQLTPDLVETFIDQVYFLLTTARPITVYRGYETAGLEAPYGKDHPSFWAGLIKNRRPGKPTGRWWSPRRPSASIDDLKLSSMHRETDRNNVAVTRGFNRLDYYLEGTLQPGSAIYVGRATRQQEEAAFGGKNYPGGAIQFFVENPTNQITVSRTHQAH